jgi:hypothetical protein
MSTYDDYKLNLNIFAHKNPPCTGERRCNGDDIFIWSWLSTSNLRPANFLQICCALLEQADRQTGIVLPNDDETTISCQGHARTIGWEPFDMRIFNNPAPMNALDATLASCLLSMRALTDNRSERLSYGKHSLYSNMVFSRYDILNSYNSLAGKTLNTMRNGLRSIRIVHFLVERLEQEKLHERLEEGKPQQADAKKRKRVKAEKAKDAKNNEEALPPRAKGTRKISRSPPRSKRQKRVGGAEPA